MATNLQSLLDSFRGSDNTCGDLVADSRIFFSPLVPCNRIPSPITLTVDAIALAIGDETISLSASADVVLEQGRVLYITATDTVTVLTETELTVAGGPVLVPIEVSTVAAAAAVTFDVIERLESLSVESSNLNFNFQTEESNKQRQGLRKNTRVTGIMPAADLTVFLDLDDGSIWRERFLADNAITGKEFWTYLTFGAGEIVLAGPTIATSLSITSTANSLLKLSTTVSYNDEWVLSRPYRQLSAADQTSFNELRACLGLAALM